MRTVKRRSLSTEPSKFNGTGTLRKGCENSHDETYSRLWVRSFLRLRQVIAANCGYYENIIIQLFSAYSHILGTF